MDPDNIQSLIIQYKELVDGAKLITLSGLIIADFILGVVVALKERSFSFNEIARFLCTDILPLVGGYFVVGVVALFEDSYRAIVPATLGIIGVKLLADIAVKLGRLGVPGINKATSAVTAFINRIKQ